MKSIEEATALCAQLYAESFGLTPLSVHPLPGAGSNRRYFRITSPADSERNLIPSTLVGVVGTEADENKAFIELSRHFASHGLPVPHVHAVSADCMVYLQDDLGDQSLYALIMSDRNADGTLGAKAMEAAAKTMRLLPHIQFSTHGQAEVFASCYPQREMDRTNVMFDLNYFKYNFLKFHPVEFNEYKLQADFEAFASNLLSDDSDTFLYRDFQSRNVMLKDGEPYFIDFQGGRRGPIYYDVASFVGQARAKYTNEAVGAMIDAYISALGEYKKVDKAHFLKMLKLFRVFRLLQNLGTYGYRGLFERKKAFVESIPAALSQLDELLGNENGFPYLHAIIREIARLPMFVRQESKELTVDVISFSYKRGIPDDPSGNGGGFVFDCRSIHNPGRYEPYKKLTGMDEPVIKFLETESNISEFLENAYALVDNMVDTYRKRGFTHIQVCCGCTGGQHRSVYSAEHIAHHVADKFGVRVVVTHKMQNRRYVIEART